jgi:AcrR family transcriptional regulator
MSSKPDATSADPPDLRATPPSRARGINTYELILATAGELLAEVGFERLTTNLVCERAGLTPPALYRYFPNKYALLSELARRLMEAQDEQVFEWLDEGGRSGAGFEAALESNRALHKRLISVTRRYPGGAWILRAIRAIPVLQEVRAASRDKILGRLFDLYRARYPHLSDERLRTAMRLSEQLTYAAIEMIVEDPNLDEDLLAEETAWMVTQYHQGLARRADAD